MIDKPTPPAKPDDAEQSKRFIDMAREIGVDERPEAIDEAFKKVIPLKTNIVPSPPIRRKPNSND
jgi:hypothetical protein